MQQIRVAALESGENECRWFCGMSTVLASVADREVIERGIHDLDSFVRVSASHQDQTELKASLGILVECVMGRCPTSGVFRARWAGVWIGHRRDALEGEGLGSLHCGIELLLTICGVELLQ